MNNNNNNTRIGRHVVVSPRNMGGGSREAGLRRTSALAPIRERMRGLRGQRGSLREDSLGGRIDGLNNRGRDSKL